ncbi:hypothetical protein H6775_03770 [Candidatus Nomurabacteria bacterium]|nr:hypothetical protein [Candidatus Nomurabacteria bacterium]
MINIYNNHHNGDVHLMRGVINFFKKHAKDSLIASHKNSSRLTSDLCPTGPLDSHHNQSGPLSRFQGPLQIINSWFCQPQNQGMGEISLLNYVNTFMRIFPHAHKFMQDFIPPKYPGFNKEVDEKIEDLTRKDFQAQINILICNEDCESLQHSNQDFSNVYKEVKAYYPIVKFFFANKRGNFQSLPGVDLEKELPRTKGQYGPATNLPEISRLSHKMHIIVGGGSGPYEATKVNVNLMNPVKSFVCYSNRHFDVLWADPIALASGIWTKDSGILLQEGLIAAIERLKLAFFKDRIESPTLYLGG